MSTALAFLEKGGYDVRIIDRVSSLFLPSFSLVLLPTVEQNAEHAFLLWIQAKVLPAVDAASTDLNKVGSPTSFSIASLLQRLL